MIRLFRGGARNTFFLLFDRILRLGVGFIFSVYVARYLGTEDFGRLSFAQSFIGLIAVFSTMGLESIVVRELLNHPQNAAQIMGSSMAIRVASSVFSIVVLLFLLTNIDYEFGVKVCIVVFSLSFLADVLSVFTWHFLSQTKGVVVMWSGAAAVVISSVFKIYLIFSNKGFVYFSASLLIESFIAGFLCMLVYARKVDAIRNFKVAWGTVQLLLTSSWPLLISAVMISIYMKIDQLMIQAMLSYGELGVYSVAVKLTEAWYFLPTVLLSALFPSFIKAKLKSADDFKIKMQATYNFLVALAGVITIFLVIFGNELVLLLYGPSYANAGSVLVLYAWATVFVFLGVANGRWMVAEGIERFALYRTFVGLILNVLLNLLLIPKYGIEGAAIATVIAQFFASYFLFLFVKELRETFYMQTKALLCVDYIRHVFLKFF